MKAYEHFTVVDGLAVVDTDDYGDPVELTREDAIKAAHELLDAAGSLLTDEEVEACWAIDNGVSWLCQDPRPYETERVADYVGPYDLSYIVPYKIVKVLR